MSPQCRFPAIQQTVDQSLSSMNSNSQEDTPLNQRHYHSRCEGLKREEEEEVLREGLEREKEEEVLDRAANLQNTCNVLQPLATLVSHSTKG